MGFDPENGRLAGHHQSLSGQHCNDPFTEIGMDAPPGNLWGRHSVAGRPAAVRLWIPDSGAHPGAGPAMMEQRPFSLFKSHLPE